MQAKDSSDRAISNGQGRLASPTIRVRNRGSRNLSTILVPTPVTLLSGQLGAGKTELVRRLLLGEHNLGLAVIVNEIGSVGIDGTLMQEKSGSPIVELSNGSICCSLHGGLHEALAQLAIRRKQIKRLIIEPTGEADPSPIAHSFMVEGPIKENWRLDGIITVVDSKNVCRQRQMDDGLLDLQIELANVILLNKSAGIASDEMGVLLGMVTDLNPLAAIYPTERCIVDFDFLFNLGADSDARLLALSGDHHHSHTKRQWAMELPGALDAKLFSKWFGTQVLLPYGGQLPRSKGILNINGCNRRVIVQGVFEQTEVTLGAPWKQREQRMSKLVVIGKKGIVDQDALTAGFQSCLVAGRALRLAD